MTGQLRNVALGLGLALYRVKRHLETGSWGGDVRGRNGVLLALRRRAPGPRILVHGVSVGETHAVKPLVRALANASANVDVVVSASTETGFARAARVHQGRCEVVRFPLDFTWMVRRFLDVVRPDLVVLAELELWPSFMAECARRGVPVCVVNGRMSARSFRGYRVWHPLVRGVFGQLALVMAQTELYRDRFRSLGVPTRKAVVEGSLKWDAALERPNPAVAEALASEMGIDRCRPLVVAGSTGPGEEEALLRRVPHGCQLLLAPRNQDRWDEVANRIPGIRRRSRCGDEAVTRARALGDLTGPSAANGDATPSTGADVFLLDTLGELPAAYSLADAVFVGRSLVPMGGSNPLESIALGKPTVIGPHYENFDGVVTELLENGGVVVSARPMEVIREWLADPEGAKAVARGGRCALDRNRGVALRMAERLLGLLD